MSCFNARQGLLFSAVVENSVEVSNLISSNITVGRTPLRREQLGLHFGILVPGTLYILSIPVLTIVYTTKAGLL